MDITSFFTENFILIGSILLIISILAGNTSYRFGVPTLIFFLLVGMLAGSEGIGQIEFNDPVIAQFIGIIALNFILFSGGFETSFKVIKPIAWAGLSLSTLGVLLTAFCLGGFVYLITDFTLLESLLLGSIVSSTDAAAVFSILRSKSIALKANLRPTLELESGSNDPMAYFLTITFTGMIVNGEQNLLPVIPNFFVSLAVGAIAGILMGKASLTMINKIQLGYEGLYPVLAIALMLFTYSATTYVYGNGFLAVYIMALFLGNQRLIHKKTLIRFFDGIAWLMQIVMFLTLGLLVFPSQIVPVIGIGLLISLFLIIVARPVSVFISLMFSQFRFRKKLFISWVGLRGAVPIVFATFPLLAGIDSAVVIFNIVFFISLTSVVIQGTTIPKIADLLRVSLPDKVKQRLPVDIELSDSAKSALTEILVESSSPVAGKRIVDLNFPRTANIAMIKRDGNYITPNGSTVLNPNDRLLILAEDDESMQLVHETLEED